MFQFLLSITFPEHNFVGCDAFNPFPMTSSDFLSGLEKAVILKPCNRDPIILLTQMIQKNSWSKNLPLLTHLISLSVGSELYADMF